MRPSATLLLPTRAAVHVPPGGHHVTGTPGAVLLTTLGPCVAACIRDPVARVGGMNHFTLAHDPRARFGAPPRDDMRFGDVSMPRLIADIMELGGRLERLEASLFGGAAILGTDIGEQNADFARRFLARVGIPVRGSHLGSDTPRRVQFSPHTGRILLATLGRAPEAEPAAPSPSFR